MGCSDSTPAVNSGPLTAEQEAAIREEDERVHDEESQHRQAEMEQMKAKKTP